MEIDFTKSVQWFTPGGKKKEKGEKSGKREREVK
jgi:hypothetical protein